MAFVERSLTGVTEAAAARSSAASDFPVPSVSRVDFPPRPAGPPSTMARVVGSKAQNFNSRRFLLNRVKASGGMFLDLYEAAAARTGLFPTLETLALSGRLDSNRLVDQLETAFPATFSAIGGAILDLSPGEESTPVSELETSSDRRSRRDPGEHTVVGRGAMTPAQEEAEQRRVLAKIAFILFIYQMIILYLTPYAIWSATCPLFFCCFFFDGCYIHGQILDCKEKVRGFGLLLQKTRHEVTGKYVRSECCLDCGFSVLVIVLDFARLLSTSTV